MGPPPTMIASRIMELVLLVLGLAEDDDDWMVLICSLAAVLTTVRQQIRGGCSKENQ